MSTGFKLGLLAAAAVALSAVFGYRMVVTDEARDFYREQAGELKGRIDDLESDKAALQQRNEKLSKDLSRLKARYEEVVDTYNTVVTRTAVTELLVQDNKLTVIIRTVDGSTRRIETPFDPGGEIYVDYVVLDGRLWIRRVFDGKTPPDEALLIDPAVAKVNWDSTGAPFGKAVYRSLDEGRWIITVTGDGSLGLAPASEHEHAALSTQPKVEQYDPIEKDLPKPDAAR